VTTESTEPLNRAALLVDEARAALAAGKPVDRDAVAARIRAAAPPGEAGHAIAQLDRVLAVARARARLARELVPAPSTRRLRAAIRTKPMLTANMEVRRHMNGAAYVLAWDADPSVTDWELRIAERIDARSDYIAGEARTLPVGATSVEIPLGERALRIHLLGRGRGGKLLRRAVIAGLSRENWSTPWQKRASAA
jgi:hypothetical protein